MEKVTDAAIAVLEAAMVVLENGGNRADAVREVRAYGVERMSLREAIRVVAEAQERLRKATEELASKM